jgi:hypothetical protein
MPPSKWAIVAVPMPGMVSLEVCVVMNVMFDGFTRGVKFRLQRD